MDHDEQPSLDGARQEKQGTQGAPIFTLVVYQYMERCSFGCFILYFIFDINSSVVLIAKNRTSKNGNAEEYFEKIVL